MSKEPPVWTEIWKNLLLWLVVGNKWDEQRLSFQESETLSVVKDANENRKIFQGMEPRITGGKMYRKLLLRSRIRI